MTSQLPSSDQRSLPIAYLWSFRRCPYAMRARMALDVSQLTIEYREILLKDKPKAMLADSPKGTVPVLRTREGKVFEESLDIMRWALAQHDPESWLGEGGQTAALIETWLKRNDEHFKPLLDRYKYFNRHPELTREEHFGRALPFLDSIEEALSANGFLVASHFTLADAALLPFIRQFHFSDPSRLAKEKLPLLRKWLDEFLKSERFYRVMVKRELWQNPSSS